MKNQEYKYGYKIGGYIATNDICFNCFEMIFNKNFKNKRKKIRWLSNIEVKELMEILMECIRIIKKDDTEDREVHINNKKEEILNFLR